MKAEDFWELYMNSTENTLDIYDEAMAFFAEKLPEGFEDEYDVLEVILEVQGHHKTAKKFDKVINFVHLIKEKQPDLYKESSIYSNEFLINYYSFFENIEKIEKTFAEVSDFNVEQFNYYLTIFKNLWYYQHIELIEKAVDNNFEAVRDSDELMGGAEYDLVIVKWFGIIEKYYLEGLKSNYFDKEKIIIELEKYGFEIEYSANLIKLVEKGLFDFNPNDYQEILSKNKQDGLYILQAQFSKAMLEKGFRFAVSGRIWELMMRYWKANNQKTKNHFAIDNEKFDGYVTKLAGGFFNENSVEMYALLWGSVYIYDFLQENELINIELYNNFTSITRKLKGIIIANQGASLWEYNFIHKWQKPSSISDTEFIEESKIFEKSSTFNRFLETNFLEEISTELALIGELSEHITNGEIKQKDRTSLIDSIFTEHFLQKDNQKPVAKELKETIGRNDPCHCGSGKKFKKCCMK